MPLPSRLILLVQVVIALCSGGCRYSVSRPEDRLGHSTSKISSNILQQKQGEQLSCLHISDSIAGFLITLPQIVSFERRQGNFDPNYFYYKFNFTPNKDTVQLRIEPRKFDNEYYVINRFTTPDTIYVKDIYIDGGFRIFKESCLGLELSYNDSEHIEPFQFDSLTFGSSIAFIARNGNSCRVLFRNDNDYLQFDFQNSSDTGVINFVLANFNLLYQRPKPSRDIGKD